MSDSIANFLSEHFRLIVFLGGFVYAQGRSTSRHNYFETSTNEKFHSIKNSINSEINHNKEYVDLKTNHMNDQIEAIKKSIDNMTTLMNTLCKRIDKIIDK